MMIDAVRAYLAILKEPPATTRAAVRALARALDRLSCAYHDTVPGFDEKAADPPDLAAYEEMRIAAVRAFPDFGFYAVVRPTEGVEAQPMFGDAIDDLADIASELIRVEWCWVNSGPVDATWQFRLGYRAHWGRHLHDLRGYVHARQFEGDSSLELPVDLPEL